MRNHRTTAELQQIVGPDRAQSSKREIASAERELAIRVEGEEALFQRKLTRSGMVCAVIGAFCVIWPTLLLLTFSQMGMPSNASSPGMPFIFRHFGTIYVSVAILQVICGFFLLVGGLALRARKPVGSFLVAIPIVLTMVYDVVFVAATFVGGPLGSAPWPFAVLFILFSIVWGAFLLFLLWLPLRFFTSPRVRSACAS